MQPSVADVVTRAAHTLFGRPLVHTWFLPTIIETIVSTAICPSWTWRSACGSPGRFIHDDGTAATVSYFVRIDHRGQFRGEPDWWSLGRPIEQALSKFHSDPDLFILARHPSQDLELADHRNALQWEFFVLEAMTTPGRSIEIDAVRSKTAAARIDELSAALTWSREALRRRFAEEEKRMAKKEETAATL